MFPAHAGMNRRIAYGCCGLANVPRTRGDEPAVENFRYYEADAASADVGGAAWEAFEPTAVLQRMIEA